LAGVVVWVNTPENASESQPPGVGIRFIYKTNEEREAVEKLVNDLMQGELGEQLTNKIIASDKDKKEGQ
jgi:Tfp pilus assembly protein PilZ